VDVVIQLIFPITHLLNADSESAFTSWTTTMDTAVAVVLHTFDLVVTVEHGFLTNTRHNRLELMTIGASLKEL
jgi:hypothetical protein